MNWTEIFKTESEQEYFKSIQARVSADAKKHTVYPALEDMYNAFKLCKYNATKVVILGQDPYFNPGEAHGLSFSVPVGVAIPSSLRNIFKELKDDVGVSVPQNGCLTGWAAQGILLLNSCLTVRKGEAGSHSTFGWHQFTDKVISFLNEKETPVVFIFWGNHARKKKSLITNDIHCVIESAHPSGLSSHRGFFGSKPFSKTNEFLIRNKMTPIDWSLINK